MNRRYAAAAAGLALLCILLLWNRGGSDPAAPERTDPAARRPVTAITAIGNPGSPPRRTAIIEPSEPPEREFDPYEEWDTRNIIENFMVPSGLFSGMSLSQAVDRLREIFLEHGGRNVEFRVEGEGGHILDFSHDNVCLHSLAKLCAGLAGYEVEIGEGEIVFRRLESSPEDAVVVTTSIPHWQSDGDEATIDFDPFGPELESVAAALRRSGIDPEREGINLLIDGAGDQLLISASGSNQRRIAAALSHLTEPEAAGLVQISQKIITAEGKQPFDPAVFADSGTSQPVFRRTEGSEGFKLLSSPTVVARAGQKATVEIGREIVYISEPPNPENGMRAQVETKAVGTALPVTPYLAGLDRVELMGAAEFTGVGDQQLANIVGSEFESNPSGNQDLKTKGEGDFRTYATDFSGQMFDGNTATILAAEADGTKVYQAITVRRLRPDGTPLLPDPAGD